MTASLSRRALIALVSLTVLVAACGGSGKGGSDGGGGSGNASLIGSGSTFQKTFDDVARQAFHDKSSSITVDYSGGGSGKGKTDLQTKTVDFAGTDSTVKPEDLSKYQGGAILYFPTVAAPITVAYNLSGVDKLQLSPETIAKIFSGAVTKWNDAAIAADNAGTTLPATNIVIVHRADGSGTTSNFTKFLVAAAASAWTLGGGDTVNWPADAQAGQGNAGVAQIVKSTDGAIGYVDFSDATAAGLSFTAVKNAAGTYVAPSIDSAAAAVAATTPNPDLTYNPINASGADSYPITSPTWIIVYAKQSDKTKGNALKAFLQFVLTDGQALAADAKYAKLPDSLRQKAVDQLSKLEIPA